MASKVACTRFMAWDDLWNLLDCGCGRDGLRNLLDCGRGREYPAVAPPPPSLWGAPHATMFKAVQFNERAVANAAQAQDWICRLMARGICVRLKAVLTLDVLGRALLVDAARGKDVVFHEVASIPVQVRFGEMEVLTSSTTVEAAMEYSKTGSVLSRMFILLAAPVVEGLGDVTLPTADELLEDFKGTVELTPVLPESQP